MKAYISSNDMITLEVHSLRDTNWNGLPVPLVTYREFRGFISAWHWNDPNGLWNPEGVALGRPGGPMLYDDGESDEPEKFEHVGQTQDGEALFAIEGWDWEIRQ